MKQRNRTNTSEPREETQKEQAARLQRAVEGIERILKDQRAIITVKQFKLVEGRMIPEIQIQILK